MKKIVAYLASPFGFSEAGKLFYNTAFIPLIIKIGFEIRDPWSLTPPEIIEFVRNLPDGEGKKEKWKSVNSVIGSNNAKAIKESDIIVAVLDGPDIDSGTAGEIGYGSALGKTVVGYRSDFRLITDNEGGMVNLQIEYFIRLNGGEIVTDLQSLEIALINFRNRFLLKK